jgi:hypothetical protein
MIEIERQDPRLLQLLDEDRIATLAIRGELHHAGGRPRRVFLDDPDRPTGMLVIGEWVKIHARTAEALERLLPALEGFTELSVSAVEPWVLERLALDWRLTWETPCWLWYLEPGELQGPPNLHPTAPLRPEHAALVNSHWEHGDEGTVDYIRWRIEDGPSFAVYEQREPVSWGLTHWDGALGPLFTLPHARGRGYGACITWQLTVEVLARGETPYLFTLQQNLPPQRLARRFGFRQGGDARWFGAVRQGQVDTAKAPA